MFASHTPGVEALVGAQTEKVIGIIEPVMEVVVATNSRVFMIEQGHDELVVVVSDLSAQVAELTTRLAAAETVTGESQAQTLEIARASCGMRWR